LVRGDRARKRFKRANDPCRKRAIVEHLRGSDRRYGVYHDAWLVAVSPVTAAEHSVGAPRLGKVSAVHGRVQGDFLDYCVRRISRQIFGPALLLAAFVFIRAVISDSDHRPATQEAEQRFFALTSSATSVPISSDRFRTGCSACTHFPSCVHHLHADVFLGDSARFLVLSTRVLEERSVLQCCAPQPAAGILLLRDFCVRLNRLIFEGSHPSGSMGGSHPSGGPHLAGRASFFKNV